MENINVLSLFDGVSCANIALNNLDIDINNYYSSEVDSHAINISKIHFPKQKRLGNVMNINKSDLPKIDLLIGGSPCQDLSVAQVGEGLNGKKSNLFFEFVRLIDELQPKVFLLENVKNKWLKEMDSHIGYKHSEINSKYYSAQNRPRCYWSNKEIRSPEEDVNNLVIDDILEKNVDHKYFLKKDASDSIANRVDRKKVSKRSNSIALEVLANKDEVRDNERQRRIYSTKGKSPTILARSDCAKIIYRNKVRKLTPLECERLQGLPDGFTADASDTQRYKMIGNAFTVPVIEVILKQILDPSAPDNVPLPQQLALADA
jgi:DNA-cytosine methyltransferase